MYQEVEVSSIISPNDNGRLIFLEEGSHYHFNAKRVFSVKAPSGSTRGQHAHRECNQLLVCLSGRVLVKLYNGKEHQKCLLSETTHGIYIPAGVWAEQDYLDDESLLLVLCDMLYDEGDYIRSQEEYLKYIGLVL